MMRAEPIAVPLHPICTIDISAAAQINGLKHFILVRLMGGVLVGMPVGVPVYQYMYSISKLPVNSPLRDTPPINYVAT